MRGKFRALGVFTGGPIPPTDFAQNSKGRRNSCADRQVLKTVGGRPQGNRRLSRPLEESGALAVTREVLQGVETKPSSVRRVRVRGRLQERPAGQWAWVSLPVASSSGAAQGSGSDSGFRTTARVWLPVLRR